MSFTDVLRRRVLLNQQPVEVPEEITGKDLMALGAIDSQTRDLVIEKPDGSVELVPKNKRIRLRDGDRLETQIPGHGGA